MVVVVVMGEAVLRPPDGFELEPLVWMACCMLENGKGTISGVVDVPPTAVFTVDIGTGAGGSTGVHN